MADEMNKEREADALIRKLRDVLDESRSYIGAPSFSPSMDGEAADAVALADHYLAGRASLAASAGSEPVAWRLRNTAFRSEVYEYFKTQYLAECRQKQFNASVDDGGLHDLTPLYTHPSPPEGAGWRPIETAPKDGTWIELWRTPTDFGRMSPFVIARWESAESMFVWPEFCDPFTKYGRDKADADIAEGDCYGSDDFTHWRALSSPPASEAKGA